MKMQDRFLTLLTDHSVLTENPREEGLCKTDKELFSAYSRNIGCNWVDREHESIAMIRVGCEIESSYVISISGEENQSHIDLSGQSSFDP